MKKWGKGQFIFTTHALQAIIVRGIQTEEIMEVIKYGEVIADYPEDKPYPSKLFFNFVHGFPLHVVAAYNNNDACCIIITCYQPDPEMWRNDFKKKK